MKLTKKLTGLLLAIVLCLTSSIGLTAICRAVQSIQTPEAKNDLGDVQMNGEWAVHTVDGKTFLYNSDSDKKILQVFGYNENGDLVETDLEEYARLLNESAERRKIEQESTSSGSGADVSADEDENRTNSNSFYRKLADGHSSSPRFLDIQASVSYTTYWELK